MLAGLSGERRWIYDRDSTGFLKKADNEVINSMLLTAVVQVHHAKEDQRKDINTVTATLRIKGVKK